MALFVQCVSVEDEMDLSPLNLGMIAMHYYIRHTTVETFAASLKAKSKLRGVIEILSAATEFETLAVRLHEDKTLRRLGRNLHNKLPSEQFHDTQIKVNVLLQAHFSRLPLHADLKADQKVVVSKAGHLIQVRRREERERF